ncbi:hypothetical protein GCM10023322_44670 [Rugosimonospora acidiphila]|uniref:Uncharacterized protein n=1 Tax=Rugosimonospora acidiphila TaxID=556531 RepID=A0ABP9S2T8_9ACTN
MTINAPDGGTRVLLGDIEGPNSVAGRRSEALVEFTDPRFDGATSTLTYPLPACGNICGEVCSMKGNTKIGCSTWRAENLT